MFGGVDKDTKKAILEYRNQSKYLYRKILVRQLMIYGITKHVIKALFEMTNGYEYLQFNLPNMQCGQLQSVAGRNR